MEFRFYAWLVWLLFKLPAIRNIVRRQANQFEVSIRNHIGEMSDEGIEDVIKNLSEGGYDFLKEPYSSIKAICDHAGIDLEVILQWLKDEKFLRAHRKKYQ
jgi:hypothetical protein